MRNIKKKIAKRIALALGVAALYSSLYGLRPPIMEEGREGGEIQNVQQDTLKVLSANIARGQGHSFYPTELMTAPFSAEEKNDAALGALEELIKEEEIDLACFQEIENSFITKEHQPRRLARNTQLKNYVFAPNFSYSLLHLYNIDDGNALLSRFVLWDPQEHSLEEGKSFGLSTLTETWIGAKKLISSEIDYQGQPIHVFCVHLSATDTTISGNECKAEFAAVFDYVAKHTPAIIMGDFNTVPLGSHHYNFPDGERYATEQSWNIAQRILDEQGVTLQYDPRLQLFNPEAVSEYPGTFLGPVSEENLGQSAAVPNTKKTIDYILVATKENDALKLELLETRVDLSRYYSDHAPVLGTVKVSKK